jgi:deoxyribodipyrimidine photo-lyase
LGDLPALLAAADNGPVLACFVLDPRLESTAGRRRMQFLCDSLRALREALNGGLLVTRGRPEERIPLIARQVEASAVHVSAAYTPFGRRRDQAVLVALGEVPLVATGSGYLVSPGRVTKADGSPYRVFTPFFRAWRGARWRAPARSGPDSATWLDPDQLCGSTVHRCEVPDPGVRLDIPAREAAASRQWATFVADGLERYAEDRDWPGRAGTSRMSAHLKFGTIHPRTLAADLDLRRSGDNMYLREIAFRDFYAAVLYHWPASTPGRSRRGTRRGPAPLSADQLSPHQTVRYRVWWRGHTLARPTSPP